MMESTSDSQVSSSGLLVPPPQANDVANNVATINNNSNSNSNPPTLRLVEDSPRSFWPPASIEGTANPSSSNCLSLSQPGFLSPAAGCNSHPGTIICSNGEGCPSVVLNDVSGQGQLAEVPVREQGSFAWLTADVSRSEDVVGQDKRHSRHSHASQGSTSSESSAGKRARRLAKKVTSMTPGTHWRRLRNTLKAAQEMQGNKKKQVLSREDSFLRKFSTRNQRLHSQVLQLSDDTDAGAYGGAFHRSSSSPRAFKPPRYFAVQHDGNFMFNWLGVVTLAVLYNLWTCILRQAFREVQQSCSACWITIDVVCDLVYLLDILVQFRTGYLNQGLMVYDSKKLALRYIRSKLLYVDALCLCPLDFIQLYIGLHPMVRFPRFLKVYRTFRFLHMLESRTAYPNLIRVANLTHILFLGAHWFAAFYYMISEAEDFKGKWSYPRPEGEYAFVSRKYLASLFWSTLTLTTIGDLPPPENGKDWGMSNAAYVFVIVSYLLGVFVFATIVGQVGNVINNRNASRQEFERLLDGAKVYMQTHNVPGDLQKRVQRWYDYVWSRGRLNGCDINSLGLLPDKLKTELAIHVNLETLKKVTIFQECQPEFLHDLVLKMKAYIFTPGDLICRRGEVAREMFIIADGVVEIISESGTILKQMGAGDFFGEIGILNLDGGINRRTADVRSVGYAELFVLSRDDVLGALKDHPDAESIIRDYGQRRLREIEAHRQKVKPLKQMGTLAQLPTVHSRPRINMRNTSRCTSPTQPPGSSAATNACSGGKAPDVFTQTRTGPGGKTYTYCYTGDDMDSRLSTSLASDGFFRSFFSSVRQIFHRKVRRQKQEDDLETGSDRNCAWTTCWEDDEAGVHGVARLCCATGSDVADDGDCAYRSTDSGEQRAPPRATHVLQRLPTGYAPVLSEEEDESHQHAPPQSPGHQSVAMDAPIDSATYKQCLAADTAGPTDLSKVAESVVDNQTVVEMNYVVKSAEGVPETNPYQTLFPVCSRSDSKIHDGTCCEGDKRASLDRSRLDHSRGDSRSPKSLTVKLDNELKETNPTIGKCTAASSSSSVECSAVRMFENLTSSFSSAMHSEQEQETPQKMAQCGNPSTTLSDGPTIRVDSASTIQSADSNDLGGHCTTIGDSCCDVSEALMACRSNDCRFDEGIMGDFLHPDYPGLLASSPHKSMRERNGKDVKPCRCRSHSAPDIFMQERAKTSAQSRLPGVASCLPSAGTAVDAGFLVAPPSTRRIDWVQRSSARLVPWSKPASPAMTHVLPTPSDVSIDRDNVAALLVQLQTSHDQLHIRMKELEETCLTNNNMLERLGEAQAHMLALLTDRQLRGQQKPKTSCGSRSSQSTAFQDEGGISSQ